MGRKESNQTNKQTNKPSVRTKITFHMFMCGSKGGTGGPDPPENHKNIGFPSITDLDLLKITKQQSQHLMWAIISPPAKRHFNGVSLVGRYLPAYGDLWSLAPLVKNKTNKKNKFIRVGPPLTKLSGSAHDVSYLVFGKIHTKIHIKKSLKWTVIEIYLYLTF